MGANLTLFIPSMHKLSTSSPQPSTLICSPSRTVVSQRALAIVAPSRPSSPPPVTPLSAIPRRGGGHKHTAESKRKISAANRGNVPWNKGRRHSEETKRKIAEATRRAMLEPGMRDLLRERARGRKHSEATKLKIRETALAGRQGKMRRKRRAVPFVFDKEVVKELNERVARELEEKFEIGDGRLVSREKRVMSMETRDKLSKRIKDLWNDPDYRDKVLKGVESRARRLREEKDGRLSDDSDVEENQQEDGSSELEGSKQMDNNKVQARHRLDPREEISEVQPQQLQPTRKKRLRAPKRQENSDVILDADALNGLTKEDLGIFGTHASGPVDLPHLTPQTAMTLSEPQLDSPFEDTPLDDTLFDDLPLDRLVADHNNLPTLDLFTLETETLSDLDLLPQ